ncbi:MAG: signal peptidase II [Myxococcota bacterium]
MTIKTRLILILAIPTAILILDQLGKFWAFERLSYGMFGFEGENLLVKFRHFFASEHPLVKEPVVVFESFWNFKYAENTGAIFGLASDWRWAYKRQFLLALSLLVALFIVIYYFAIKLPQRTIYIAILFILGGAFGNIADRIIRGYVIDFIDWHFKDLYHWPTFNIADCFISVGAFLLGLNLLRSELKRRAGSGSHREVAPLPMVAEESDHSPSGDGDGI